MDFISASAGNVEKLISYCIMNDKILIETIIFDKTTLWRICMIWQASIAS